MRYILNNEGYICHVSFGAAIECSLGTCTEYKGKVPNGYSTIEDWHEGEIDRLNSWKIVDGNLVLDPNRDYKLRMLFEQEEYENSHVSRKELGMKNTEEISPYANLFPNVTRQGTYINWTDITDSVGNFPVNKVELWSFNDLDSDLIELEFTGKNLLPNTAINTINNGIAYTMNIDKTIDISGTATSKSVLNLVGTDTSVRHIFTFKRGETSEETQGLNDAYYDYVLFGLADGISLEFYNYDGVDRTLIGTYRNNEVIRFEEDTNVTQILLTVDNGTTIDTKITPMLFLAYTDLQYPVLPMKKYTGNLFNKDDYTSGSLISNTTGKLSTNASYGASNYIPVKAGITYYQQNTNVWYSVLYDSDYNYIQQINTKSFTPTEDGYIRTSFLLTNIDIVQVKRGSKESEYEAYNGRDGQYYVDGVSTQLETPTPENPSEIINLYKAGTYNAVANDKIYEITIDEDLRGLPNGVGDRLWIKTEDGIDIERKVGKVVLDGSENWVNYSSTATGVYKAYTDAVKIGKSSEREKDIYSNYFVPVYINASSTNVGISCTKFATYLTIPDSIASTVDELKTWLSSHNTEVIYELAEYTTSYIPEYIYYPFEYEEYKNNTTLIDLAGNKFERFDSVVIENNQAMLVKEGALKYVDENGNVIEKERKTIFLGYVSMPRTYTPYTYVYSHQRAIVHSFEYRDSRNIDITKIDMGGILSIDKVETKELLVDGGKVYGEYVLFDNAVGQNENITLNDNSANYAYIEIFYRDNDNQYSSVKVYSPNGKVVSLGTEIYSNGATYRKVKNIKISYSNITNNNYGEITSSGEVSNSNNIYITRIIGFRDATIPITTEPDVPEEPDTPVIVDNTKSISANGSNGHHRFTLEVKEESVLADKHTLSYSFTLSPLQTGWDWNWSGQPNRISLSITIGNNTYTGNIGAYDGSSTIVVSSGNNIEVSESSINISFTVTDTTGQSYTCGNASASDTMTLTTI